MLGTPQWVRGRGLEVEMMGLSLHEGLAPWVEICWIMKTPLCLRDSESQVFYGKSLQPKTPWCLVKQGQFLVLGRELCTQFESGQEASERQNKGWPEPLECVKGPVSDQHAIEKAMCCRLADNLGARCTWTPSARATPGSLRYKGKCSVVCHCWAQNHVWDLQLHSDGALCLTQAALRSQCRRWVGGPVALSQLV